MNKIILHIDFNSYFATVEQQANPRLRGKPIGVTGGDRLERTVLGAASVEAKVKGVKTGMTIPDALRLCPEIIFVRGDSDKYLECTKRFLNILKNYSPFVEIFSIDEVFLQLPDGYDPLETAISIKQDISQKVGGWITCSIGISYNKRMAKMAGSLQKPDGLNVIEDEEAAMMVLDQVELDEICGIGSRIKKRLNNMGIFTFAQLRKAPLELLLLSFKSYGQILYDMARGIDHTPVLPFYEKEEVKSAGHRHTLSRDTSDPEKIKQTLIKISELVAKRLRDKKLVGKTVHCYYRSAFNPELYRLTGNRFFGEGKQSTIAYTSDGLEVFKAGWDIFHSIWDGGDIRMIGISVSNLQPQKNLTRSLLPSDLRNERIIKTLDNINDRFGDFTLQRATILGTRRIRRQANPFLSDRRFKI